MNNLPSDKPLTDDELARLAAFPGSIGESAMSIEMLDGAIRGAVVWS